MQNTEGMRRCYKRAKEFLVEMAPAKLNNVELGKYFNIEKTFKTKEDILFGLLKAAQNYNMMKNVIGLENTKKKDKFKEILYEYKAEDILRHYCNSDSLYKTFCNNFSIKRKSEKNNCWTKYSKAVISAAEYVNKFETAEDFDKYVCEYSCDSTKIPLLPKKIEKEIFGIGFPTACNFLKELGYTGYSKPDTHIKDIFKELKFCDDDDNVYKVFDAVVEMANVCNETPYNVDKTFWLICSGNFYLHSIEVKGEKEKLIEEMRRLI